MYLLDSNACIAAIKDQTSALSRRLDIEATAGRINISAVVAHELWFGVANSANPAANGQRLRRFLDPFAILPFSPEDAETAGEIRADLRRRGTPIGPYDVLIAGQAVRRDLILVTANVGEFSRVPGLRWEDWSQA